MEGTTKLDSAAFSVLKASLWARFHVNVVFGSFYKSSVISANYQETCYCKFVAKEFHTSCRFFRCSLKFLPMTITSSKQTKQVFEVSPRNTNSINLSIVAGALQKGSRRTDITRIWW